MISTDYILSLYRRYTADLQGVRRQQYWFHRRHDNALVRRMRKLRLRQHMLFPALDDIEAEITYLLIRDRRPKAVMEMSPNSGWSTTWILTALRANANGAHLWSYDLHDTSTKLVPLALSRGRWHFVQGDARETATGAPECDHVFIDSDHSPDFARWYTHTLFPRLRPGTLVSVHDVFHGNQPSEEGEIVLSWLAGRKASFWTSSPAAAPAAAHEISQERRRLGLDYVIQRQHGHNPMLFFVM
jgi:predicted O-methyltransferase YrrM